MLRMWDVLDVECTGCGMFRLWDARDAVCLSCRMFGMWDVQDVGSGMFAGMWDVDSQNSRSFQFNTVFDTQQLSTSLSSWYVQPVNRRAWVKTSMHIQ